MSQTGNSTPSDFVDQSDPGIQIFGTVVHRSDVQAFCDAHLPDQTCRACHQGNYETWLYSPSTDRVSVATSVKVTANPESGGERFELNSDLFMPMFYMICDRCGHVQNHTVAKVVNWMKLGGPNERKS
jgi:hypothetical protein